MIDDIFDDVYTTKAWGDYGSLSGKGAGDVARQYLARPIVELVTRLGVTSVLDLGCGDGYWMPDLPGYIGMDVSKVALGYAKSRHPERDYRHDDGSELPHAGMVISRCVVQHLPVADGYKMLQRIRRPTWLLMTSYDKGSNTGVNAGDAGYWPDMRYAPFNLGEPVERIRDGQSDDKDMDCILGLWSMV